MSKYIVPESNEVVLKTINSVSLTGVGNVTASDITRKNISDIAIGDNILLNTTTGIRNVGIGLSGDLAPLKKNTAGDDNIAIGWGALYENTIGSSNIAIGQSALFSNTTAYSNVAIGVGALDYNTIGIRNTAVGSVALDNLINYNNCSGLGFNSAVTGSNQVQLGDSSTTTYVYGTVQNRSDLRDKADVRDTILGLDFINKLRPVDYKWDMREDYRQDYPIKQENQTEEEYQVIINEFIEDNKLSNLIQDGTKKRNRYHHGLIAQEVRQLLIDNNIDFGGYQDHTITGGDDVLSIGYDELIAPLIKAVQELSKEVKLLKEKTINL